MKKCLLIELWFIGDATLMTAALQGLLADGWEITVLAKAQSRILLEKTYPTVRWIEFDAPWTAFRNKYRLWRYPWRSIIRVLRELRRTHFDATVSIRKDPRDHLFFWLARVPRRIGFRTLFSDFFLNEPVPVRPAAPHRVEDWWEVQEELSPSATEFFPPRLVPEARLVERYRRLFAANGRPVLALHAGARIAIRRWPETYFRQVILALRAEFDFQFVLFSDMDGYGNSLRDLADQVLDRLDLAELQAALSCTSLLLANDSGPGHVADALGVPVITIFGPGDANKLRPFSVRNHVVMRDICPYHPCSDYCRFPEPYCLTRLTPALALPEIREHLAAGGLFQRRQAVEREAQNLELRT